MSSLKIALFASGKVGLAVASLIKTTDEIVILGLADQDKLIDEQIKKSLQNHEPTIVVGRNPISTTNMVELLLEHRVEAIITVYWPFILDEALIKTIQITVNFHPAMLPQNRGWFPHVHSILDGSPTGVTLHKLAKGADTGDIWAQKHVPLHSWDTAKDIYDRLQTEMVYLFSDYWPKIKSGELSAFPQDHSKSSFHSIKEIEELDLIELEKEYKAIDLINLLRARTFGQKGFAYFEDSGRKVYLRIALELEES
jgi:methionyl-tRNA formyltransferase